LTTAARRLHITRVEVDERAVRILAAVDVHGELA
jgi:hypothetical protein